ncbi:MAG: tandem-95 repeat protein, partial [Aggregatilineales bacterium]
MTIRFTKLILLFMIIVFMGWRVSPVHADVTCDYTISAGDENALFDAITDANNDLLQETICLEAGTYNLTRSVPVQYSSPRNHLPIIQTNLVIEGNGSVLDTERSTPLRFFEVGNAATLTLNDLTLTDTDGNWGTNSHLNYSRAIMSWGNLTLNNVTIDKIPSGLVEVFGHLSVNNSEFSNSGNVITARHTAEINDSAFHDLSPEFGVITANGEMTVIDNSVFQNIMGTKGLLSFNGDALTVTNSRFVDNGNEISLIYTYALESGEQIQVHNSCIVGGLSQIVKHRDDPVATDISNNWWGGSTGPTLPLGDDNVTIAPVLQAPPQVECAISPMTALNGDLQVLYETASSFSPQFFGGLAPYSLSVDVAPTNGVVSGELPDLIYTPENAYSGIDTFTYVVTDANLDSASFTYSVNVDTDLAVEPNHYYTAPDMPLALVLGAIGGTSPYTFSNPSSSYGTLTGELPDLIYTPTNSPVVDNLYYDVTDADGFTRNGYVVIHVAETLTSVADFYEYTSNDEAVIDLTNLHEGGQEPFTYEVSAAQYGTSSIVDGTFTHTLNNPIPVADVINLTITDANGSVSTSTLHISNANPMDMQSETVGVPYETSIFLPLAVSGGLPPYTFEVEDPANGVLSGTAPNLVYTPNAAFMGMDYLAYVYTDSAGFSNYGYVDIQVAEPFELVQQTVTTSMQTPITFDVRFSGGLSPYDLVIQPAQNGMVSNEEFDLTYTPDDGFTGTDQFYVELTDSNNVTFAVMMTVVVNPPQTITAGDIDGLIAAINAANSGDVPVTIVLEPGIYEFTGIDNTTPDEISNGLPVITSTIRLLGTGSTFTRDLFAPSMRFINVSTSGIVVIDGITFEDGDVMGDGGNDGGGAIINAGDLGLINVNFLNNSVSYARGGAILTSAGSQLNIENSVFEDNTASSSGGAIHIESGAEVSISNSIFRRNVSQQIGGAIAQLGTLTLTDSIFVDNTATNRSGAIETRQVATTHAHNNCIVGNSVPSVNGSWNANNSSYADFTNNWWGTSEPVYFFNYDGYINATPALTEGILGCPTVTNQNLVTFQNTPIDITLPTPTDGVAPFTYEIEIPPTQGTISGTMSQITYTPNLDIITTIPPDSFYYRVTDANGLPAVGRITISVVASLIAPDFTYDTGVDHTVRMSGLYAEGGLSPVSLSISDPEHGTISNNIDYTPDTGFSGVDTFTYTATDAAGNTATGTITINVFPLTLPETVLNLTTPYQTLLRIPIEVFGGVLPYSLTIDEGLHGTVMGELPELLYVPDDDFSGVDTFTFAIMDDTDTSHTVTVNVTTETQLPATIFVDTLDYEYPYVNNGNCTIGEAVLAANSNQPQDNCATGTDTSTDIIQLPAGEISLQRENPISTFLIFSGDTILRGMGNQVTSVKRDSASELTNLISVSAGASVTIEDLTLANGWGANYGGAIVNAGDLTVRFARFETNHAGRGGAVANYGDALIYSSVFHSNTASSDGDAIYNFDISSPSRIGEVEVYNSAFSQNGSGSFAFDTILANYSVGQATFGYSCVLDTPGMLFAGDVDVSYYYPASDYWRTVNPNVARFPDICRQLPEPPIISLEVSDVQELIDAITVANTFESALINLDNFGTYDFVEVFDVADDSVDSVLPVITSDITIFGHNSVLAKDPSLLARFFTIRGGTLSLYNMTIENGYAAGGVGGAVDVTNGSLIVQTVTFDNNRTDLIAGAFGGAIHVQDSSIDIDGATFSNNSAYAGAAIYMDTDNVDIIEIRNTIFDANTATATGAVHIENGNFLIFESLLRNNTGNNGSAVYINEQPADLQQDVNSTCVINNSGISIYSTNTDSAVDVASALNNWWGSADGPSGAGSGNGDAVGDGIYVNAFVNEPYDYCFPDEVIADDQSVRLYYHLPSIAVTLSATGGVSPHTFTNISTPTNGTVTFDNDVTVTYTPESNFLGTDTFTFDVFDSEGNLSTGTITVNVTPATIYVDSLAQEIPFLNNGNCTFGEAIIAANTDTVVDGCSTGQGADLIELIPGTYTFTAIHNALSGATALPQITTPIDILGNGAVLLRSDDVNTPMFRFMAVTETGSIALRDMTLRNGYAQPTQSNYGGDGGALLSGGTLVVQDVTFENNSAYRGGAVAIWAGWETDHYFEQTNFSGNYALVSGGGLNGYGQIHITDSVFENNTAEIEHGGGAYFEGGAWVTDTVFNANTAPRGGNFVNYTGDYYFDSVQVYGVNSYSSIESSSSSTYPRLYISNSCLVGGSIRIRRGDISNNWWGSESGPGGDYAGTGTALVDESNTYSPYLLNAPEGCDTPLPRVLFDTYETAFETPIALDDLQIIDGIAPFTFTVSDPANGSISGDTLETLVYTPDDSFYGFNTFEVIITDSTGATSASDISKITVHVYQELIVEAQNIETTHETPINISLMAQGGTINHQFIIDTPPQHGSISGLLPNLIYTPDADFSGQDSFIYAVTDGTNALKTATITVNVGSTVMGLDESISTFQNTSVTLSPRATLGVPPYRFTIISGAQHGLTLRTQADTILYLPEPGFVGMDEVQVEIVDANGDSDTAILTISVSTIILSIPPQDVASLIDVISDANATNLPTIINLTPHAVYTLMPEDTLPIISGNITLNGNGATIEYQSGNAAPILVVGSGGWLTVDRLTLSNGAPAITNSNGSLSITNSTLTANIGVLGGGILHQSGDTQIINTTISGNQAQIGGGVYVNVGTVTITNATIANNMGKGIVNTSGSVTIGNTIIESNQSQNCSGNFLSAGNNIDSDISCNLTEQSDNNNTNAAISPLADNGGPTFTHALASNSIAVNRAGANLCYQVDQRGANREAGCDIGAFEYASIPTVDLSVSYLLNSQSSQSGDVIQYNMIITNNGQRNAQNVVLNATIPENIVVNQVSGGDNVLCEQLVGKIVCYATIVSANTSIDVSIVAQIDQTFIGDLMLNATVISVDEDSNEANNVATLALYVVSQPLSLILPSDIVTDAYGNPTFTWTDTLAESYELYVARVDNTQIINPTVSRTGICNGTICSIDLTTLAEANRLTNGAYQWYVREAAGVWVGPMNFTLNAPPPGLVTLGATTGLDNLKPTFNWTLSGDAINATYFNLYLTTSSGTLVFDQWFTRSEACGALDDTTCSLVSPVELLNNTAYTLYVRSYGPGGYSVGGPFNNGYAGPANFTITATYPMPISPNGTVNLPLGNPTYTWTDIDGADYYYVYVANVAGQQVINEVVSDVGYCNGTQCQIDATTLRESYRLPNGAYTFYVRGWKDNQATPWSGGMSFTVNSTLPGAVTKIFPLEGESSDYATSFQWNEVANVSGYNLYLVNPNGVASGVLRGEVGDEVTCST